MYIESQLRYRAQCLHYNRGPYSTAWSTEMHCIIALKIFEWVAIDMTDNRGNPLAGSFERQMSLVNIIPDVSTQSRVFIMVGDLRYKVR